MAVRKLPCLVFSAGFRFSMPNRKAPSVPFSQTSIRMARCSYNQGCDRKKVHLRLVKAFYGPKCNTEVLRECMVTREVVDLTDQITHCWQNRIVFAIMQRLGPNYLLAYHFRKDVAPGILPHVGWRKRVILTTLLDVIQN